MRGDEHWDLTAQHEREQRALEREEETLRHAPAVHPTFAELLNDWRRAVVDLARLPEEKPR